MFEVNKDLLKEGSSLRDVDQIVLDTRRDLLIKFSKIFSSVIKLVNMGERSVEGSFSSKHFATRGLSLSIAINSVIDRALDQIKSGSMVYCTVNRRKAQLFADEGNIDHEGKHSIFGQLMQCFKKDG